MDYIVEKKYQIHNPFLMDYNRLFRHFVHADHILTI